MAISAAWRSMIELRMLVLVSSNRVSGLGPQLFPSWEDSTKAGPDVLMSTTPENPRVLAGATNPNQQTKEVT